MEESSEVLLKYQKLALEYSKLKAQISVLKSAIADEQTASSESQDALKKKDQLIRKLEQEVECLNFRNLQLTKRVSVLQNDLENVDSGSKHSKHKPHSNNSVHNSESYNILNVELQNRIEENERLHQQVSSLDAEHKKTISELTSTIERLESKLADQEQHLNDKVKEQDSTINSLVKEKVKMQLTLKNYEQEIKEWRMKDETNERDTAKVKENLQCQLESAQTVVSEKVQFNDTRVDHLNSFNVPIMLRKKQDKLCILMLQLHTFVCDITHRLSELHTYMEQKVHMTLNDAKNPAVSQKLEGFLRESIQHLKTLQHSFGSITSSVKGEMMAWVDKSCAKDASLALSKYVSHIEKMLPYLTLSMQLEENQKGSTPKIKEVNNKFSTLLQSIVNCLKKLENYVQLLIEIGSARKDLYHVSQSTIMKKILTCLLQLHSFFEESRKVFGTKIAADHLTPIINETEKSTNECILTTLVSISTILKKLISLMEENLELFIDDIPFKPRNLSLYKKVALHPCVWIYNDRGAKYISDINQPEQPSIPYELALKNNQTLSNYADNHENLTQQLEQYRNKLMQLELDKENWMLECQLMKAKESRNQSPSETEPKPQEYDEIQAFVKGTVNQLMKQIQLADGKFIAYRNECEMLYQKLKMSLEKKMNLETEVQNSKQVIECSKEEQKNLMKSYDEQLNMMSEHLANLNETLAAQKDEIDLLKQAGNHKVLKKGKSK